MDIIRKDVETEELQRNREALKNAELVVSRVSEVKNTIKQTFQDNIDNLYCEFVSSYIDVHPEVSLETLGALMKFNEYLKKNA